MKIKKAIIPAAGFGTRFLPQTKAMPKEMLPIVDNSVIQYVVEEAVASGISDIVIVTGWHKRSIEDHFDDHFELEHTLRKKKKTDVLKEVKRIADLARFTYVRQRELLGDGHALLSAWHTFENEVVAVLHGDIVFQAKEPALAQLLKVYERYQDPIIAVKKVPKREVVKWGIVGGKKIAERVYEVEELVEKPKVETTPSNLGITGRYIVTPEIMQVLKKTEKDETGEIRIIDGFKKLLKKRSIYAVEPKARYYDTGNKLSYLKTVVEFALSRPDVNGEFSRYLKGLKIDP